VTASTASRRTTAACQLDIARRRAGAATARSTLLHRCANFLLFFGSHLRKVGPSAATFFSGSAFSAFAALPTFATFATIPATSAAASSPSAFGSPLRILHAGRTTRTTRLHHLRHASGTTRRARSPARRHRRHHLLRHRILLRHRDGLLPVLLSRRDDLVDLFRFGA